MDNNNTKSNSYTVPAAIIIAGALIAGALYFVSTQSSNNQARDIQIPTAGNNKPERVDIRGVQTDDHIRGNRDAKLVIVEFSDTECPFCKRFHGTMQKVIDTFSPEDVAWIYRNFPLTSLHQKATQEAVALECAAELGGNDKFWEYTDMLYEKTPSNDGLDLSKLPEFAKEVGLDVDAFNTCLKNEDMIKRVQEDLDEAVASGGTGTPYNIILYKDQQIPLVGAIPFEDYEAGGEIQPGMKSIIEGILAQ